MSKFACAVAFSLIALAVVGCKEAPPSSGFAANQRTGVASSGVVTSACGALGDCPVGTVAPYPMQGNWGGF